MRNKALLALLFLSAVAACSLSPKDMGHAYMFALSPVRVSGQAATDGHLTVGLPAAAPELDTSRVGLIRDGKVWDYYAGTRWAEFLPVLVQDSMIKTLENTGTFKSVASDQSGVAGGKLLKAEIRSFQAEYVPGKVAPVIRVGIAVSLLGGLLDRKPIASFEISGEKTAASDSLPAIQSAFQDAFNMAQKQLVEKLTQ